MKDTAPTYVTAEKLRTRYTAPHIDRRGTPRGDRAQVWEQDRTVTPPGCTRRVREHITVMHCAEGWYSASGAATQPAGDADCSTEFQPHWRSDEGGFNLDGFDAFHDVRPVLWFVQVTRGRETRIGWFCDAELPDEYRPEGFEADGTETEARARRREMKAV